MKILLDECCPKPLRRMLPKFHVSTVEEAGFKGLSDGQLLKAAEGVFDVLITADKSLRHQQNLAARTIIVVELPTNSWKRLTVMTQAIEDTLHRARPGQYYIVPSICNHP